MKKALLIFLCLLISASILSACSKEEKEAPKTKEPNSAETAQTPGDPDTKAQDTDTPEGTDAPEEKDLSALVKGDWFHTESDMTISFDGNGNCTMYDDGIPFEGSYTYDGEKITITDEEGNQTEALLDDNMKKFVIQNISGAFLLATDDTKDTDNDGSFTADIPTEDTDRDTTEEDTTPSEEAVTVDPTPFYGCWKYEEFSGWIIINEDQSYTYCLFNEYDGDFLQDGPYSYKLTEDAIYLPEYDTYLYYDEEELYDSEDNILARDEIFNPISE